jgi:GTP cyclohydrolase I
VAKMYVRELFAGRYSPPPHVTEFPNSKRLDELYTVGPITVRSTCSHHFCPVTGSAWLGVVPGARLIGLSKFNRIADWVLSRPQIQEEAVVQLADAVERLIEPRGLGVVIKASHSCMTMRGVKDGGTVMTTSVMRGLLFTDPKTRSEFFNLLGGI